MKTYKLIFTLISFSLFSCTDELTHNQNNQNTLTNVESLSNSNPAFISNTIKILPINKLDINGSSWINTPMEEFPNCIDSLIFSSSEVFSYSCEHAYGEPHKYEFRNDSIYVEKWDVINNVDSTKELKAKEWFILTSNGLVCVKVQRKRGDFWDELDPKYLNKFYFQIIK